MSFTLDQFDYQLPSDRIANAPASPRDHSQLMRVNRHTKKITHHHFYNLPQLLPKNAVLVLNRTKVFPARLYGHKKTGGKVELLLLQPQSPNCWTALSHPGLKVSQTLLFEQLAAEVIAKDSEGIITLSFNQSGNQLLDTIHTIGHTPLPPYIHSESSESTLRNQYQTIYAKVLGSVAAPTAGLHFTKELLGQLRTQNITVEYITLHVGLGTFKNPTAEQINTHTLHHESYELTKATANRLNQAKNQGRPIVAVGTTSTRTLETCADDNGLLHPQSGDTSLFIQPGYRFKFVDHLITNFHLPQSSLLMLISAFATTPQTPEIFTNFSHSLLGTAYNEAIKANYRFFSFGDAMYIV